MNLIETHANSVGVKLPDKPMKPYRNFFPIPEGDYVVIESSQDLMSLNYDYFNEVIIPLKNNGFKVAQIGAANSSLLNGVEDFRGKLNFSQTCYLIEHSKLLISGDTVNSYSANYLSVPTITLYGPTIANVNKPFYIHSKSVFIESDRKGNKASLNLQEQPKTINLIKPELIVQFALDILNIKPKETFTTLFIGGGYPNYIFEVIPQSGVNLTISKEAFLNIRLDRNFDEQGAAQILSKYKASLVTNKRLNPGLFSFQNLTKVIYQVNSLEEFDIDFIRFLEGRGADYQVLTENEQIINDLKLNLFDFRAPILKLKVAPIEKLINKQFKTTRVLLANEKTYVSYWHFLNNEPQKEKSLESLVPNTLDMTFWENQDSIYVYETEKLL